MMCFSKELWPWLDASFEKKAEGAKFVSCFLSRGERVQLGFWLMHLVQEYFFSDMEQYLMHWIVQEGGRFISIL